MDPAKKQHTYQDLLGYPEGEHVEILAGEIISHPSPLPRHSKVQGALRSFIGLPYDDDDGYGGPGGWWILLEVDVQIGPHDIVGPDLVGWRRERLPDPWDVRPIDVTPDWICEIVSPSNAAHDRVQKRHLYAQNQVSYFWIIDPAARILEALRLEGKHWLEVGSYDDQAIVSIPPFEQVELDIGRLFPPIKTADNQ